MNERYAAWLPDNLKSSAALENLLRVAIPSDAPGVPNGRYRLSYFWRKY
jgi:hypothetical protein